MLPCLPNDDPDPKQRERALAERRTQYVFNYTYIPGYPFLERVPKREWFSAYYWGGRLASLVPLPLNQLLGAARNTFVRPLKTIADFATLYSLYRRPPPFDSWLDDDGFAEQRLSGCNPQAIRRVAGGLDQLPFTDDHLRALGGPARTLAEECARGSLYLADFDSIAHVRGSTWRGRKRTIPSPKALFWWDHDGDRLRTVGIQVRRAADARVFTPADPPLDWLAAKIAYQCADACHQEIGTHFAGTHMVMAPVAVITNRQLSERHPVHRLLAPHFRFYLFDNELGRVAFINPGGPVERMLGGTLQESLGIPLHLYKGWDIRGAALPADLAARGCDSAAMLPRYPMRDDGLPIWQAIQDFVDEYLRLYYASDADVAADPELAAWSRECAAEDGGRVAGMPERVDGIGTLRDLLSTVIWICGPLHSMLNFSQWDYINLPNMSYAIYGEIPEAVGAVDYPKIMELLPPFGRAAYQLWWCSILTSYRYDQLGDYHRDFDDPRAQLAIQRFRQRLRAIEVETDRRDAARPVAFPYLKPSLCINSINT
jgi:arachidonate 15-lipoxygenase